MNGRFASFGKTTMIENKNQRTEAFGKLLKAYREGAQGGKVSQKRLLDLMAKHPDTGERYLNRHSSLISRWEKGVRGPPTKEEIYDLARALRLTPEQRYQLLLVAGYETIEPPLTVPVLKEIHEDTSAIRKQVAEVGEEVHSIREMLVSVANPSGPPIILGGPLGVAGSSAQRIVFPGAYFALAGWALNTFNVSAEVGWLVYVGVGLALVFLQSFSRLRRAKSLHMPQNVDRRRYHFAELLFISVFVMLSTHLLPASLTGMDNYGFFTIERYAGTVLPLVFAAGTNLLVALAGATSFHLLWLRFGSQESIGVYGRAIRVLLVPLLGVYVPVALLSGTGGEIYFLVIFALLFGAFLVMIAMSDPALKLGEWEAKMSLAAALIVMGVLFVMAIAGMLISYLSYLYLGGQIPAHGNHLWSWKLDFAALGYPESDLPYRLGTGFLWMVLTGIAYMLLVVGGYLIVTIYRFQVAPHVKKKESIV